MYSLYNIFADQTTSILDPGLGINGLLGLVVNILSYGLGAAAIIGVVVAGIMYLTARDNESQVAVAKQRLLNTVIGLIAWVVMFSVVNWLIPGSVPDPSNPSSPIQSQDRNDTNPIEGGGSFTKDDDYDAMTCSEKRQYLKDLGMSPGEINAELNGCVDGGGAAGDKNNHGMRDEFTCNEIRQQLLDEGLPMGEIKAILRSEGCTG